MLKFEAPYPSYNVTTILPNPELGDSEGLTASINKIYTMTGILFTYKKSKANKRKLLFNLEISRQKSLELEAFIELYFKEKIRLTDHMDQIWLGYLMNNPFESVSTTDEWQQITLEFEGIKQ